MVSEIPTLFDRELYLARQRKASAAQAPLLAHVADDLADRLSVILHQFPKILLIAPSPLRFEEALQMSGKVQQITYLAPTANEALNVSPLAYEAIFSLLDLHCINDVPGHLAQCAAALKPDGLFMSCCFAGETLSELRQSWLAAESESTGGVSPRVAPMIGVREMGALLQRAGLALPVSDNDHLTLRYADTSALLSEIKKLGFSNPLIDRAKTLTSRRTLLALFNDYSQHHSDADGRVRATLDLLWAMAWKPHESQPQAKKPGSATTRLADVLKQLDKNV